MFKLQLRDDLELRLLEQRHAAELFAVVDANRQLLRRWLPWVDHTTEVPDSEAFIRGQLEAFARNESITAGIWVAGELGGVVGTLPIHWANRKAEIGYWLAERWQGRGRMTAACRAMVGHLLIERGLHRVTICCATGNSRSAAIPARLGFQLEGVLREAELLNGEFHDLQIWSMLATEWKG